MNGQPVKGLVSGEFAYFNSCGKKSKMKLIIITDREDVKKKIPSAGFGVKKGFIVMSFVIRGKGIFESIELDCCLEVRAFVGVMKRH